MTALVDADSATLAARYDYSPFGQLVIAEGPAAETNRFRFSSELFDPETALVYYNYRYYSPELGRWLNRDPIAENGGSNLYSFLSNAPINGQDVLGLSGFYFGLDDLTATFILVARDQGFSSLGEEDGLKLARAKFRNGESIGLLQRRMLGIEKLGYGFERDVLKSEEGTVVLLGHGSIDENRIRGFNQYPRQAYFSLDSPVSDRINEVYLLGCRIGGEDRYGDADTGYVDPTPLVKHLLNKGVKTVHAPMGLMTPSVSTFVLLERGAFEAEQDNAKEKALLRDISQLVLQWRRGFYGTATPGFLNQSAREYLPVLSEKLEEKIRTCRELRGVYLDAFLTGRLATWERRDGRDTTFSVQSLGYPGLKNQFVGEVE